MGVTRQAVSGKLDRLGLMGRDAPARNMTGRKKLGRY
jgi:hypothetical protein